MTPAQRVDRIMTEAVGSDLSSWERFDFIPSVKQSDTLTPRQDGVLRSIENKVFGDDDE